MDADTLEEPTPELLTQTANRAALGFIVASRSPGHPPDAASVDALWCMLNDSLGAKVTAVSPLAVDTPGVHAVLETYAVLRPSEAGPEERASFAANALATAMGRSADSVYTYFTGREPAELSGSDVVLIAAVLEAGGNRLPWLDVVARAQAAVAEATSQRILPQSVDQQPARFSNVGSTKTHNGQSAHRPL